MPYRGGRGNGGISYTKYFIIYASIYIRISDYVPWLYLGVDATSCESERNFSALKLIVSDLRAKSSPGKVEKTIFLRLNKHLIYGLRKVLGDLDALKDERKSSREAPVNAKDAAAGLTNVSPILFRRNINMTSLVCGETSLGFTFFFFLLHYRFAFSKLIFSSSHFSSTCLCWVWG